jgi:hypothetical protein
LKISVLNAEFLDVSHQTLLVAKVPNRYFASWVTTRAELNEIAQYNCEEIGEFAERHWDEF